MSLASFLFSVALAVCFGSAEASAAEPPWPTAPYAYVVVDQDLRSVLQQFAANTGLRVALTDKVQGRVHGPLPTMPPKQFFSDLAQQFGLDWTYDGSIVTVSDASETRTEMLPLGGVPFDKLQRDLSTAGLLDPRFPVRAPAGGNVVMVSGPPRYLDLVQQTLAALAAAKPPEPAKQAASAPAPAPAAPKPKTVTLMRGAATSRVEVP